MAQTFCIKRHDRVPSLLYTALEDNGTPLDLSAFVSASFILQRRGSDTVLKAPAVIASAQAGTLRFDWGEGDTAVGGVYAGEFELVDAQGRKRTVPVDRPIRIEILGDLDNA